MQKAKSSDSGCCSCSHDDDNRTHENPNHDGHDHGHGHDHNVGDFNLNQELIPVIFVVVLFVGGLIFEEKLHNTPYSIGEYLVFIPAYLLSGLNVLTNASRNILRGRFFDENFLMTIATLGAVAIHKLPEAVGVMLFFKIGELFQ
ncbi:heavy metal translocating P-type ATPase, partial [Microcoleus sp. Pol1C5]